jgi:hypothetical protein
MKRQSVHLFVVAVLALLGPLAGQSRGDFVLLNDEQLTVNSSHNQGTLFDTSRAYIISGGSVNNLDAYDSSTVEISGGSVGSYLFAHNSSTVTVSGGNVNGLGAYDSSTANISGGSVNNLDAQSSSTVNLSGGPVSNLWAKDSSTVNLSGGSVSNLWAYDSSTVDISGGSMTYLYAQYSSTANISGGSVAYLYAQGSSTVDVSGGIVGGLYAQYYSSVDISGGSVSSLQAYSSSTTNLTGGSVSNLWAYDSSTVIFNGRNFQAGSGLTFDGERVLGVGMLSGEWMDGTRWFVNVFENDPTATILAITEPTHILTIDVDPNHVGIDNITPSVGSHDYAGRVNINAQQFAKCPDVYVFDHWEGDVNDPNSANTTVFMDTDKTVTAVFVDSRKCGDECHPYPIGDLDKDCVVTFGDFALFASHWLDCTKPECD